MGEFNQAKYIQEYKKEKYDRCVLDLPKGQKEIIKEHYTKKGYNSLTAYIRELIRRDMIEEKESQPKIKIENFTQNEGGTININ